MGKKSVKAKDEICVIESVKAASDIYAPIDGEITEVSGISLSDIYVSGPKGKIADVSSRSVSADVKLVPGVFALHQNYPNPFNPETWIPFQLHQTSVVTIQIYNSDGGQVQQLELGQLPAGLYHTTDRAAYWNGQNQIGEQVASGIYFYQLNLDDYRQTRKMVILK